MNHVYSRELNSGDVIAWNLGNQITKGISLGSVALGEASYHVMRIIKLLRGEAHVLWSPANSHE